MILFDICYQLFVMCLLTFLLFGVYVCLAGGGEGVGVGEDEGCDVRWGRGNERVKYQAGFSCSVGKRGLREC